VGEWAKIWPLHMLFRFMGAFFVRRNSGNPLYRRTLERYIHMATREGVCQAVFLEGGLSRDGRLREPKLGLMDYMLRTFDPAQDRDIVFIPVGINYDRTIEDRSLLRSLIPGIEKRSRWFIVKTTTAFILRNLMLVLLSRWRRYGYACVNFGPPLSIKAYCRRTGTVFSRLARKDRFPEVARLCTDLMEAIKAVMPVLPVALVSAVFLDAGEREMEMDLKEIVRRANIMIETLRENRAPILETPSSTRTAAIAEAVERMRQRRMLIATQAGFRLAAGERPLLRYYANAIVHWLPGRSWD
jgi:glycerol-3-phosphate O-acyltransferase